MNKLIRFSNVVGLFFLLAMGVTGLVYADGQEFEATLSGAQEVMDETVFAPLQRGGGGQKPFR